MAKIFLSSTRLDLRQFREAAYKAIRQLGHSVVMDDSFATDAPPLEVSLEALRASDVVVVLVGWRYGFVPTGQTHATTELEVMTAMEAKLPCLVFMVSDDAPWPANLIDTDRTRIQAFRERLQQTHIVNFVRTPNEVASRLGAALHRWTATGRAASPTIPDDADQSGTGTAAEVFVSYAHEDAVFAEGIAARLVKERWSVFWDRHIPVGMEWDNIVEEALDAAKCVVVLWSSNSRDAEWVRIEAAEGADRHILAPALLEEIKIPLRFRRIQAASLMGWAPQMPDTAGVLALVAAVRRCVAASVDSAA